MKRIDSAGAATVLGQPNHWTQGNPSGGTPATVVSDDYMNILMEEICYCVEHSGGSVDQSHTYTGSPGNDTTQLYTAIKKILAGGSGGATFITFASSPYTAVTTKNIIPCDCTNGAITVNLPSAASVAGETFKISKVDPSGNAVTVTPNGTDQIIGANASQTIANQYAQLSLTSLGSQAVGVGSAVGQWLIN